jgi:hypothetical protein
MATKNCISAPNSCVSGTVCYNFGIEPSCVRKDNIIPLDSYEFIAYQSADTSNNTIAIDIIKYKYYRYQSLTLEPVLKYIYIVISYSNTPNTNDSLINKIDIPTTTDNLQKSSYYNPSTSKYITNLPNEFVKKISTGANTPTPPVNVNQLVSFTLDPTALKSAIPTRLIIKAASANNTIDFSNIGVKSIQFEDVNGIKSKVIPVKNITAIEIDESIDKAKLKQENDKAMSSIKKAAIMLNNLQQSLTYVLSI